MRTEAEVESYRAEASRIVRECKKCDGSLDNTNCDCVRKYHFEVAAFEACIPRDFWFTTTSDITVNVEVFKKYIKKYVARLNVAQTKGYGFLLSGSNGCGKSTFVSYVLANAIRRGRSTYYTTLPQLDHDMKRGFDDVSAKDRLEVMLTSDFLVLDEMNKEFFKDAEKPAWIKTQIERLLKRRYDENKAVLMATNATMSQFAMTYGATVASLIAGKYQVLAMEPGDARRKMGKKMLKDMSF